MAQASPAACSSAGSSTASTVAGTAKSWRSRSPFSSVQHQRCSHESCSSVQIERFLADSSEHRGSFCRHNHRARGLPPRSMGQPGRARRRQHAAPSLTLAFQSDSGEASSSSASSHFFKKKMVPPELSGQWAARVLLGRGGAAGCGFLPHRPVLAARRRCEKTRDAPTSLVVVYLIS